MGLGSWRVANTHSASMRAGFTCGALDMTWPSPCGTTTMSPLSRRTGAWPLTAIQPLPRATMWNSMTCSAPGSTASAISRAGGASAAQSRQQLT